MNPIAARGLAEGEAQGALLITPPISFLGDIDIRSGRIVGALKGVHGRSVKGMILAAPSTRGSNGSWRFLYQLYKFGQHPAAIITEAAPDPSLVQGAILAGIPVLCAPEIPISDFPPEDTRLQVTSSGGVGAIRLWTA